VNAETRLRLKSPSSPWPTASWRRMPGHPGPRTTVIVPAGAATAAGVTSARRAGSRAERAARPSGGGANTERAPPPAVPRCRAPLRDARDAQVKQRTNVAHDGARRGDDQDDSMLDAEPREDVGDARVDRAGGRVDARQERDLVGYRRVDRRAGHGVEVVRRG